VLNVDGDAATLPFCFMYCKIDADGDATTPPFCFMATKMCGGADLRAMAASQMSQ